MGLVDTNCDPDPIQYVIACNDDALKSIKLILQAIDTSDHRQKNEMLVPVAKKMKTEEKAKKKLSRCKFAENEEDDKAVKARRRIMATFTRSN